MIILDTSFIPTELINFDNQDSRINLESQKNIFSEQISKLELLISFLNNDEILIVPEIQSEIELCDDLLKNIVKSYFKENISKNINGVIEYKDYLNFRSYYSNLLLYVNKFGTLKNIISEKNKYFEYKPKYQNFLNNFINNIRYDIDEILREQFGTLKELLRFKLEDKETTLNELKNDELLLNNWYHINPLKELMVELNSCDNLDKAKKISQYIIDLRDEHFQPLLLHHPDQSLISIGLDLYLQSKNGETFEVFSSDKVLLDIFEISYFILKRSLRKDQIISFYHKFQDGKKRAWSLDLTFEKYGLPRPDKKNESREAIEKYDKIIKRNIKRLEDIYQMHLTEEYD